MSDASMVALSGGDSPQQQTSAASSTDQLKANVSEAICCGMDSTLQTL